ncbi:hypothetical protein BT67DRAFT_222193 [Trichocladium antarcticum]|uniref:Uncharacterized protein n=1 Tax=Trichocladium antarcticum TaxID=1450529 RepID=A0AAN6UCA8_9PEZI|nr:hypothetical protein BT67DRAFT_222193 [Trichocladium antarcticum]
MGPVAPWAGCPGRAGAGLFACLGARCLWDNGNTLLGKREWREGSGVVLFGVWYNTGFWNGSADWSGFSLWGVVLRQRLLFTVFCLPLILCSYTCNASFG